MKAGRETYDLLYPPLAATLGFVGWAVLLWVFQTHQVNYRQALGLGGDQFLTPLRSFILAIVMIVCDVGLLAWHFLQNRSISVAIAAYILPLVYVVIMYVMNKTSLATLCHTMWDVLLLRKVPGFREVFFTDLVTSLSKVLSDMLAAIFTIVYLLGGKASLFGPKSHLRLILCLVVTCVPFGYRLVQSLMVGYSRENQRLQFVNAFKHGLTIAVTSLSSMKFLIKDEKNWKLQFGTWWFYSALLNTILCFGWDVAVDWDARNWTCLNGAPNVESRIIVTQKWCYYVFVALDFIGRFCWTARLSPHTFTSPWIMLGLTLTELARRFLWSMVRIEAQIDRDEKEARREADLAFQQAKLTRQQEMLTCRLDRWTRRHAEWQRRQARSTLQQEDLTRRQEDLTRRQDAADLARQQEAADLTRQQEHLARQQESADLPRQQAELAWRRQRAELAHQRVQEGLGFQQSSLTRQQAALTRQQGRLTCQETELTRQETELTDQQTELTDLQTKLTDQQEAAAHQENE